jgi:hypothetical protein
MITSPTKWSFIPSLGLAVGKGESTPFNKGEGRMIYIGVIKMGWSGESPRGIGRGPTKSTPTIGSRSYNSKLIKARLRSHAGNSSCGGSNRPSGGSRYHKTIGHGQIHGHKRS